jgi:5-formyltetrahydrofolate cyclo-ligase
MGNPREEAKQDIRRRLRQARQRLSVPEVARRSAAVCLRLLRLRAVATADHVVAYSPVDNEVDPGEAVVAVMGAGKMVYYPRMTGSALEFLRSDPGALRPGRRGIFEPVEGEALSDGERVVFLVPGLAFDARGVRVGRGRGHYDRALADFAKAHRVGLAYDFQVVHSLPEAAWDVRMHAVVTEERLLACAAVRPWAAKERRP